MKFIELEFEGEDAHAVSLFICLFEQDFKKNPTDAAHELNRNLERLVAAKQRAPKAPVMRDSNIVSIRDRLRDGLPGSGSGRTVQGEG